MFASTRLTHSKAHLVYLLIVIWGFTLLLSACGEQAKSYNLGVLIDSNSLLPKVDGLKDGLKALSYTEGQNINFQVLNISGFSQDQQQAALKDFAARNYNAYWVASGPAAALLQPFISNQPIIVAGVADPVAQGVVKNTEQPGTNVTGIDSLNTELTLKRIEILLSIDPTIRKAYLVYDATNKADTAYLAPIRAKASQLGVTLLEKPIPSFQASADIVAQFKASEAPAVIMVGVALFNKNMDLNALKSVVTREKLLLVGGERFNLDVGAIFSYGSPYTALGRQSAYYVDKILHGSNPAGMPLLQPDKLELILNQKLADQFGRKFPTPVFESADQIV